jgi:hypothetical protein
MQLNFQIDFLSEGPDKWYNLRKEFSKSVPCKTHFSMFYNIPESINDFVERKRVIRKTDKDKENSKSQPSQVNFFYTFINNNLCYLYLI